MRQANGVTRDESAAVLRSRPARAGTRAQGAASAGPGAADLPRVTGLR